MTSSLMVTCLTQWWWRSTPTTPNRKMEKILENMGQEPLPGEISNVSEDVITLLNVLADEAILDDSGDEETLEELPQRTSTPSPTSVTALQTSKGTKGHSVTTDNSYAAAVKNILSNDSLLFNDHVYNDDNSNHRQTTVQTTEADPREPPVIKTLMAREIECHIVFIYFCQPYILCNPIPVHMSTM